MIDAAQHLTLSTAPLSLARLYPWLDEAAIAAGVTQPLLGRMHVALEEAVMNVVTHGIGRGKVGVIVVRLSREAQTVTLAIEDEGPEFDPVVAAEIPKSAMLEGPGAGGVGLRLLRHYCRDMAYRREAGVNRLTLRFGL